MMNYYFLVLIINHIALFGPCFSSHNVALRHLHGDCHSPVGADLSAKNTGFGCQWTSFAVKIAPTVLVVYSHGLRGSDLKVKTIAPKTMNNAHTHKLKHPPMSKQKNTPRILFLCTGNSCRSQMAEGWARHLHGDRFEIFSAGLEKHGVNPTAISIMAETGVDISSQTSKLITELPCRQFDLVITLCGHADANCPIFPGNSRKIHQGFDDPPKLAALAKSEHATLDCYRRVRNELKEFIKKLPKLLKPSQKIS